MTAAEILQTYGDIITTYATAWGLDPNEIASVIQTESSGDPNAVRAEPKYPPGSYGLMQLLYTTAQSLGYSGDPSGLFDPETNIKFGSQLWAQLKARFGDDPATLYSAYNSGSGTAYQTNPQVASNVQRFLDNLNSLSSQAAEAAGQAAEVISQNPEASGLIVLVGLGLLFLLTRK